LGPAATRVIRLSRAQMRVFGSRSRFRILNAGRRFGKTHLAAIELFTEAQNNPGSISWYVAPTYRQAQQIMWTKLKELIPAGYIASKNETDLRIEFKNGSIIALRGSDNPDSLRGVGLDLVILDEVAFQKQDVWTKILRAALSDKMGRALFISTPCGYNWFYDLYRKAKTAPDWEAFQFTTIEGGNVPLAEIEAARAELDEKTFRQEYEASFESLTGRVYYAFDRDKNGIRLEDNPKAPLLVGMDFNVNPMSAAFAIRNGDQVHFIGEISIPNGNTEEMCRAIKTRFPDRKVRVYPDPTGNARKTSAPVGQTDFTIIRAAGFEVLAPSHPYPVSDKLNTVNAAFKSASGAMRAFVDPVRCPELSKGFDGLTYKEGTNDPDKSLGLDHMTDAAAYLILWELPLRIPVARVKLVGV
jgi:hypothetical protein